MIQIRKTFIEWLKSPKRPGEIYEWSNFEVLYYEEFNSYRLIWKGK